MIKAKCLIKSLSCKFFRQSDLIFSEDVCVCCLPVLISEEQCWGSVGVCRGVAKKGRCVCVIRISECFVECYYAVSMVCLFFSVGTYI